MKLTDREIEVLKALKTLGYEWLARDKSNTLYVNTLYTYLNKPTKNIFHEIWDDELDGYYFSIKENGLFNFIKWEDDEPTKIDDLLKGV